MKAEAEGFNLDTETGELTPIEVAEPSQEITPEPAQDYQPTPEDLAGFGAWAAEQNRRQFEENPPTPEDYGIVEPEELAEDIAAEQTQSRPEAAEQATMEPQVSAAPGSFTGSLFDMDDPAILAKPPLKRLLRKSISRTNLCSPCTTCSASPRKNDVR